MSPLRLKLLQTLGNMRVDAASGEVWHRQRMVELLKKPECFYRNCFPGHFTASALVLHPGNEGLLLHHHRFLDVWLQFGGHCDGNENLIEVALRETEEESGTSGFDFVSAEPVDLDIHPIPANARKGEPPHEHYDVRFVLRAREVVAPRAGEESVEVRWFGWEELPPLNLDPGLLRLIAKARALVSKH